MQDQSEDTAQTITKKNRHARFRCKKCIGVSFRTISNLRTHQWAEHREAFASLTAARKTKQNRKKPKTKLADQNGNPNGSGEIVVSLAKVFREIPAQMPTLTAANLLTNLKHQRDFLIDCCNMIEGMITTNGK
jgi:hypothetical protein